MKNLFPEVLGNYKKLSVNLDFKKMLARPALTSSTFQPEYNVDSQHFKFPRSRESKRTLN